MGAGIEPSVGREGSRGRGEGGCHPLFPAASPAITTLEATDHTELGDFGPGNAMAPGPGGHLAVTVIGPTVSCLLMAPKTTDLKMLPRPLQHLHNGADPNHQGLSKPGQGCPKVVERFQAERPLASGGVRLPPQRGLNHHQRQHRADQTGLQQRLVIQHPQIPLEPDNLER